MGFSSCVSSATHSLKETAAFAIPAGFGAGAVSWLGRSITNAGFFHGFGFGLVVGATTRVVTPFLDEKIDNEPVAIATSAALGGVIAYGLSAGAAALGIIAAPITVTGALILTISSVAFALFGKFVEAKINENCCNKKSAISELEDDELEFSLSVEAQQQAAAAAQRRAEQKPHGSKS